MDDYDRVESSGLTSPLRQSFHQPFAPNFEAAETTSPISEAPHEDFPERTSERQVSFAAISPGIGTTRNESDTLNYTYSLPEAAMNWSNGSQETTNDVFGHGHNHSDSTNGYSFDSQGFIDPSFMNFDSAMNFQQQQPPDGDAAALTTSFDTSGLPFHALDVIRNYTPGVDDGQQDNLGLWQGYDGGEFRYDADLQFSLGDLAMDTTNHQE